MASSPSPGRTASLLAGRYAIRRKLGSGATGSVYLVDDLAAKRRVALKLIGQEELSPRTILRFQEEFRALAALRHPQIAAAYNFGYAGKLPNALSGFLGLSPKHCYRRLRELGISLREERRRRGGKPG